MSRCAPAEKVRRFHEIAVSYYQIVISSRAEMKPGRKFFVCISEDI